MSSQRGSHPSYPSYNSSHSSYNNSHASDNNYHGGSSSGAGRGGRGRGSFMNGGGDGNRNVNRNAERGGDAGRGGSRGGRGGSRGGRGYERSIGGRGDEAQHSYRSSGNETQRSYRGPAPTSNVVGPVSVFSNCFPLTIRSTPVYRHDVSIQKISKVNPVNEANGDHQPKHGVKDRRFHRKGDKTSAPMCRKIVADALKEYFSPDEFDHIIYDGDRILYYVKQLQDVDKEVLMGNSTFQFSVRFLAIEPIDGQQLQIIFKNALRHYHVPVGNHSFYPHEVEHFKPFGPRDPAALRNKVLALGASFVPQYITNRSSDRKEPVVFVSVVHSVAVIKQQSANDFIFRATGLHPNELRSYVDRPRRLEGLEALKGLDVSLRHLNDKKFRIISIAVDKTARSETFSFNDTDISVENYFKNEKKVFLEHAHDWPLIETRGINGPSYFPLELCSIEHQFEGPGSRYTPKVKTAIQNISEMSPKARRDLTDYFVGKLLCNNKILDSYGIQMIPKMKVINSAVVLPPPTILYGGKVVADVSNGAWRVDRNSKFFLPKPLQNWVLGYFPGDSEGFLDKEDLDPVVQSILKFSRGLGMRPELPKKILQFVEIQNRILSQPPHKRRHMGLSEFIHETEYDVEDFFKEVQGLRTIELVVVVVREERSTEVRSLIKRKFDENGIASTHLLIENTPELRNKDKGIPQHYNNVLSKINVKLGGQCHFVKRNGVLDRHNSFAVQPDLLSKLLQQRCLVIGADVCKPGNNMLVSIVGIVGSYDLSLKGWKSAARAQRAGTEIIENFETVVEELLEGCRDFPRNVLYVRDGVSEGEQLRVQNEECLAIEKAFIKLTGTSPAITNIIVTKRIDARFFPINGREKENVSPGLLIQDDLLPTEGSEKFPSFYMVPHAGIKGTSAPVRFFILRDDIGRASNLPSTYWPYILFDLCHIYQRCQKSVSYPAPAYYAHWLAERACLHVEPILQQYECASSTSNRRPVEQLQDDSVLNEMNKVLKHLCDVQGKRMFFA